MASAAAAGFLVHGMRAGGLAVAIAASLPPLAAAGPGALITALTLGLLLAWQRTRTTWVLLAGGAFALLPGTAGLLLPALAGGIFLALAPWPSLLIAVPVSFLGVLAAPPGFPFHAAAGLPVAFLSAALVARAVAGHPANLSMARSLVRLGLALASAPAAVGLLFAALRVGPVGVWEVYPAALATAGLGLLLLLTHLGAALLLEASDVARAPWLLLAWAPGAASVGFLLPLGAREAALTAAELSGLLAVPASVGTAWLLGLGRALARAKEAKPAGTRPSNVNL